MHAGKKNVWTPTKFALQKCAFYAYLLTVVKKQKAKQRRNMRSFEVDQDIEEMLDLALKATGTTLTKIVNSALRRQLGNVVVEINAEREAAMDKFLALKKARAA